MSLPSPSEDSRSSIVSIATRCMLVPMKVPYFYLSVFCAFPPTGQVCRLLGLRQVCQGLSGSRSGAFHSAGRNRLCVFRHLVGKLEFEQRHDLR